MTRRNIHRTVATSHLPQGGGSYPLRVTANITPHLPTPHVPPCPGELLLIDFSLDQLFIALSPGLHKQKAIAALANSVVRS
ncbi:hypothetical protein J6590_012464 [Homalodisca vitripennis]|nr:hypothetical protein J6590_012464 [Homalodisca vitripennis]